MLQRQNETNWLQEVKRDLSKKEVEVLRADNEVEPWKVPIMIDVEEKWDEDLLIKENTPLCSTKCCVSVQAADPPNPVGDPITTFPFSIPIVQIDEEQARARFALKDEVLKDKIFEICPHLRSKKGQSVSKKNLYWDIADVFHVDGKAKFIKKFANEKYMISKSGWYQHNDRKYESD